MWTRTARLRVACVLLLTLAATPAWAQGILRGAAGSSKTAAKPAEPAPQPPPEPPKDPLGRDTPRGTVLEFMNAARNQNLQVAAMYLDSGLRDKAAEELAQKLFVVLDRRLSARLVDISDRPEGSMANPLKPDSDVVGSIMTENGPLELVLERVTRGRVPPVWLFSRETLKSIPDAFAEVDLVRVDRYLPGFVTGPRMGGVRVLAWVVLLLVVPLCYRLIGVIARLLARTAAFVWRHVAKSERKLPDRLPGSLRLLLLAITARWLATSVELPFRERQFWSVSATLIAIPALVWVLLQLNAAVERYVRRRLRGGEGWAEVGSLLLLARRGADVIVVVAGLLVALRYFGVDPTAALAGLGIGGIAIALAAQKTLENVIGGLSIIFDQAVRVGDFLKIGETLGTVDFIGLRSTRIRTLDRTVVSMPNGQIAVMGIETLSTRDKFWFRHYVGLRYETTPAQIRAIVDAIQRELREHQAVEAATNRVRFLRLGASSLDVEVFAYIFARDWDRFLEIQEELLLRIMEIVAQAGTSIALPSQTLQLIDQRASVPVARRA